MLAMVALFPRRQLGVEMGAILLIFTGQVWNMAFSFYSSLKSIPREMRESAKIYRFNAYQRFMQMELPYAAIGLVWNSMMSVAGGWFFLMACEMFVLGKNDFRLPGLGSYLQTAASAGDTEAILWGRRHDDRGHCLARSVYLATNHCLGRKVQDGAGRKHRRAAILVPRPDGALAIGGAAAQAGPSSPCASGSTCTSLASTESKHENGAPVMWKVWTGRLIASIAVVAVCYALVRIVGMLMELNGAEYRQIMEGAGATFGRVLVALVVGSLWTIPVGVAIGFSPRLARIAQPLAQIAASVPATALFPIVLLMLIRIGGGWASDRLSAAAGNAVVHPVQRHRRRNGDSDGSERKRLRSSSSPASSAGGPLSSPASFHTL